MSGDRAAIFFLIVTSQEVVEKSPAVTRRETRPEPPSRADGPAGALRRMIRAVDRDAKQPVSMGDLVQQAAPIHLGKDPRAIEHAEAIAA